MKEGSSLFQSDELESLPDGSWFFNGNQVLLQHII